MDGFEERVKQEADRLRGIVGEVSDRQRSVLDPVIDNVAWMKVKLEDTREEIKDAPVTIEYDNGGGQTGVRENPMFKGYESLWRSYVSGLGKIMDALPDEADIDLMDTEHNPKTVLEMVRSKHSA